MNEKGFTLLEVLVSMVLITIILTSFFTFFSQSLTFSNKNEENLVGINIASKTLKLIETNYTISQDITLTCSNFPNVIKNALHSTSSCFYRENQKDYYPEIIIKRQSTGSLGFTNPSLYIIEVRIYDKAQTSPDRKLLTQTYGYKRGG